MNLKRGASFIFLILLTITLVSAVDVAENPSNVKGVVITPPTPLLIGGMI